MIFAGAVLCSFAGCSKFLDELPDNRAELDTPEKIYKLLVSAYPDRTYVRMCEPTISTIRGRITRTSPASSTRMPTGMT